jgi:hypothetical protein
MTEPRTHDDARPAQDPLLAALRQLPAHAIDAPVEARLQRQARAAYVRRFEETSSWYSPAAALVGRAAVPVFLAGVVSLYMTWAISTATSLFQ